MQEAKTDIKIIISAFVFFLRFLLDRLGMEHLWHFVKIHLGSDFLLSQPRKVDEISDLILFSSQYQTLMSYILFDHYG